LLDHTEGLLFPSPLDSRYPIHPHQLRRHAAKAWRAPGLEPLGFHEAQHTFATISIAAGMNAKTLSTLMGHASINVTFDRLWAPAPQLRVRSKRSARRLPRQARRVERRTQRVPTAGNFRLSGRISVPASAVMMSEDAKFALGY
jgi:integrase